MSADFVASKLGSLDHWQAVYDRELDTFDEIGDEGEVWFGVDASEEMVDWCLDKVPPSDDEPTVLDVGMGNGQLCFAMNEAGYTHVTGIDYSLSSVALARKIAVSREVDTSHVSFDQLDIIAEPEEHCRQWSLVLDKGTYDAISLSDELRDGRPLKDWYPVRVSQRMTKGAKLLITSCNFTKDELVSRFVSQESKLQYVDEIKRPSFEFGGQKGQTITTVAFEKTTD